MLNNTKIGSSSKRTSLDEILLGKHPNYPRQKLLARLIANGYFPEECSNCGFCQKRPTDLKVPLVLNTTNGNKKDLRLENLELLLESDDSLDALSTMDILTEEEKLQMIKDLKDSF